MKIRHKKIIESDITTLNFHCTPRDTCSWNFLDENGDEIVSKEEEYVPNFIPGDFGDYINLKIDIETGKILNWNPELVKKYLENI